MPRRRLERNGSPSGLSLEHPSDHVLTLREVKKRRDRRKPDSRGIRHRVHGDLRFSRLQRPRWMMNIETQRTMRVVDREQTVALGQKIIESARHRWPRASDRTISAGEFRGAARSTAVI